MEITVLTVPNCPNAPLAEQRLRQALQGRTGVTVNQRVIENAAEAERYGMRGSPTLLINGADPFSNPSEPTSLSCKVSLDDQSQPGGVPSVEALTEALNHAAGAD